jgi:hypothetical protein
LFSCSIGSGSKVKGAISASTAEFFRDFKTGEVFALRDVFTVVWVVWSRERGVSIPGEAVFGGEKEILDIR